MVNEGTFSISENMARASLGNLTTSAVLASKESRMLLIKLREGFNAEPTLLRRLLQLWLVVFLPLLALLLPYLELVPVHAEFVV
jgi:hypothetical protein